MVYKRCYNQCKANWSILTILTQVTKGMLLLYEIIIYTTSSSNEEVGVTISCTNETIDFKSGMIRSAYLPTIQGFPGSSRDLKVIQGL